MVRRSLALIAGLIGAALYSDFGVAFLQLAILLPVWILAFHIAYRLQATTVVTLGVAAGLVVLAATGVLQARYAIAIAASLAIVMSPLKSPAFRPVMLALPVLLLLIMLGLSQGGRAAAVSDAYKCAAREIQSREIEAIATDHWSAKPLYFAAKNERYPIVITQTNFEANTVHPWMAPYSFHGQPTRWALRSDISCGGHAHGAKRYCGQETVAPVTERTNICSAFTLYHYASAVPGVHSARPRSKIDAIIRQFNSYVEELLRRR